MPTPAKPAATSARQPMPQEFLAYFPDCWVQYFDDGPDKNPARALSTSDFDPKEASRKQKEGCGVFFSPNGFDGMRRAENLKTVQAAFVDLDLARPGADRVGASFETRLQQGLDALLAFPMPPHAVVRTRNGLQAIWRVAPLSPAEGLELFKETEDLLVARFAADPAAKDVTRVLRLPGFLHQKDPKSPFLCRIVHDRLAEVPYQLREFRDELRPASSASGSGREKSVGAHTSAQNCQSTLEGVEQGSRNIAAACVAGRLLAGLKPELWETSGWGGLKEWNARNRPPLPEAELRAVFESIAGRERGKSMDSDAERGRTRAERLVGLAEQSATTYFLDQFGDAHAQVPSGEGHPVMKVRGKEFRQWLAALLWRHERGVAPQEMLFAAALALEGRTRQEGTVHPLEFRVAWHEGAVWYDLADGSGRAVRVTEQGWSVQPRAPLLFRRASHQVPQLLPVRGRPLSALLELLHLGRPETGALLLPYLVTCLVPDIPHPVALVSGPQGSAKSTLCRLLRRLIDPTCLEGLSLPPRKELPQVLFKHHFASFDNVGSLPADVSDMLCRAVTGEGISRRQLFSDDEDVIFQFRRCVCLNGIQLSARPDLLDRAIHFPLKRLAGRIRDEASVLRAFEALRPELLGALFDALSGAMKARTNLRLSGLPRMADFASWAAAAAEALGIGASAFLDEYAQNVRELHEEAVLDNPVAYAIAEFMVGKETFSGTATELLKAMVKSLGGSREHLARGLPRSASGLTKQLNFMGVNLAETGLRFDSRRTSRGRKIEITRLKESAACGVRSGRGKEGKDGISDGNDFAASSLVSPPAQAVSAPSDGGDGDPAHSSPGTDAAP